MISACNKRPILTIARAVQTAVLAVLVGAGVLLPVDAASAQEANFDGVATAAGNMSGSLSNERDRTAERVLDSAHADIRAGEWALAIRQLQDIIDSRSGALVLRDDVYCDARHAAEQMLLAGPSALRENYAETIGPVARQELEGARAADDESRVRQVARQYQYTAAGQEACLILWSAAVDRGDWDAAGNLRRRFDDIASASPVVSGNARLAGVLRRLTSEAQPSVGEEALRPAVLSQSNSQAPRIRWRIDVPMDRGAHAEIAASLSELDAQAIVPMMSARPLVHGGIAYSRNMGSLSAVNIATGEIVWQQAMPTVASRLVENPHGYANAVRRSSSTAVFLERFVRSSLTDRLTTDGTRVFAVFEDPLAQSPEQRYRSGTAFLPRNTLIAFSAEDGRVLWQAGADFEIAAASNGAPQPPSPDAGGLSSDATRPSSPDRALQDVFFMGTPQAFGRWRLVVGQNHEVVSLFAIEAETGTLEWSAPLGQVVRPLLEDRARHGTSCPVTVHKGRAYCTTAAGCVACVDLGTRRLLWAYRYPRSDLPKLAGPLDQQRPDATHGTHMPTHETWHEVFLDVIDDRVLVASPDSDWLSALDAQTGRLLWRQPRGRGLYVAGPWNDRILVIGTEAATAHAVDDGRILWSTEILRPAGTGLVTETEYMFPAQRGGLQCVRWEDGQTQWDLRERESVRHADVGGRRIPMTRDVPSLLRPIEMFNLVAAGDTMLVQSFDGLAAVAGGDEPAIPDSDDSPLATVDDTSTSEQDVSRWPNWSQWMDVVDSWKGVGAVNRAVSVLRHLYPAGSVVLSTAYGVGELLPQLRAPDEQAVELVTQLASAAGEGDQPLAQSAQVEVLVRRLLQGPAERVFVLLDRPRRFVRLDRWLARGFAEAAFNDRASRRQFTELWEAMTARLTRTPRSEEEGSAADALFQPAGGGADRTADGGSREDQEWPSETPKISEHPWNRGTVHVNTVPTTVSGRSPWESITVQVDRQGEFVWFHRADGDATTVALPRSQRSPRMDTGFLHAWANGPLLCLRIGTDLFGFRITEEGELPVAPAWPQNDQIRSVAGDRPPFIAALTDTSEDPRPVWDDSLPSFFDSFSRQFAAVGPVTATAVCYQERGHLVALDPVTGRELWCRSDLPVGTHCVGDDHHLVLLREDAVTVEVLRSSDGATVAEWDWREVFDNDRPPAAIFSHIVAVRGTLAVWYTDPPGQHGRSFQLSAGNAGPKAPTIAVIDLAKGRTVWSQDVARGSWVVKLDNDSLGVLSPAGTLAVRDWNSGALRAEHQVEVPAQLANVYVITDARTSYVVASGRVDDPRLLQATQIRGAYRRPVVNGWMHAISRESKRHLWQQRLDNIGVILDQPRHVPLLVTSYTVVEEQNRNTGVLKCFDRRTGEMLYEFTSQVPYIYHTVQSDAANRRIEVVTKDTIIRFEYPPRIPTE